MTGNVSINVASLAKSFGRSIIPGVWSSGIEKSTYAYEISMRGDGAGRHRDANRQDGVLAEDSSWLMNKDLQPLLRPQDSQFAMHGLSQGQELLGTPMEPQKKKDLRIIHVSP